MFNFFLKKFICKKYIKESFTDYLTGMRNRRSFDLEMELFLDSIKRKKKYNSGNWFIFIDLNNFKKVNDILGHQEGDNTLKKISEIFFKNFRSSDLFFRVGGDEFAVLVKRIKREDLKKLLERLMSNVEKEIKLNLEINFGLSMGVAHFDEDIEREEILERADKTMYEIKKRGGGVLFWEDWKKNE